MEAYLIGGSEAQSLSGAVMEAPSGVTLLLPGDRSQIPVLGDVLADPPLSIGVRAPFPESVA